MRLSLCLAPTISIHALCEEGDFWLVIGHHLLTISIHALCEEGDAFMVSLTFCRLLFLSTPSARRATTSALPSPQKAGISIHALCEEGDLGAIQANMQNQQFLSTPSARRATWLLSIMRRLLKHFYPRPLRGGRPARQTQRKLSGKFLSTPSARRATSHLRQNRCHYRFLSTPSARRATSFRFPQSSHWRISIHALCEEGDLPENPFRSILNDFYPRPLRGGRHQRTSESAESRNFYPRPLRGGRPG